MKIVIFNKIVCFLVLLIVALNPCNRLLSQGCSDAGVCSIGSHGKMEKGSVTLVMQYGVGEQNVQYYTTQVEGVMRLNKKNTIQVKLPYSIIQGNLSNTHGLGDVIAVWNNSIYDKNNKKVSFSIGGRIGVNNASKGHFYGAFNSFNLPMPYQTGLGTHDLLLGSDMEYKKKWRFALGLQIPIIQFNKNEFDTARFGSGNSYLNNAKQYFTSYHLKRRPDIVLRADKTFEIGKKLKLTAGVLAIYHILHDRYTDINGVERAIHGSKGLTLNIPVAAAYKLNEKWLLTTRFASPIIVRKVRPDGLTRHFVAALELKYSF